MLSEALLILLSASPSGQHQKRNYLVGKEKNSLNVNLRSGGFFTTSALTCSPVTGS